MKNLWTLLKTDKTNTETWRLQIQLICFALMGGGLIIVLPYIESDLSITLQTGIVFLIMGFVGLFLSSVSITKKNKDKVIEKTTKIQNEALRGK